MFTFLKRQQEYRKKYVKRPIRTDSSLKRELSRCNVEYFEIQLRSVLSRFSSIRYSSRPQEDITRPERDSSKIPDDVNYGGSWLLAQGNSPKGWLSCPADSRVVLLGGCMLCEADCRVHCRVVFQSFL